MVAILPNIAMNESLLRLVLVSLSNTIFFIVVVYLIGFSKNEIHKIRGFVKHIVNKKSKNKFES